MQAEQMQPRMQNDTASGLILFLKLCLGIL